MHGVPWSKRSPDLRSKGAGIRYTHLVSSLSSLRQGSNLGQFGVQLDPPACICQHKSFECLDNQAIAFIALLDMHEVGPYHYQLNVSANDIQGNPVLPFSI